MALASPFRPLLRLATIGAVATVLWLAYDRIGYDPAPWLADLKALEDSTAQGYANLEWQVAKGVADPVALHRQTVDAIINAGSRSRAAAALRNFARAFRDGHFVVSRPTPVVLQWVADRFSGKRDRAPLVSSDAASACAALGYADDRRPSNLTALRAYHDIGPTDASFATGTIESRTGPVGVIRIDAFGVDRFGSACALAWPVARTTDSAGSCGPDCRDALWRVTSDTLLAELRHAIRRVAESGATALLVDLTGNGGGNDWVDPAARQFTSRPLHGYRAGVIRHPHHVAQLESTITALMSARIGGALPPDVVDSAIATANRQLDIVRTPCDRRAIWTAGAASVACTQVALESFTTGFLPYLPASAHDMRGIDAAFTPAAFAYVEGVWSGPVVLLVDARTASASEAFVAALHDHDAAVVIGEHTLGAGCGYTGNGIGFRLPHSGLDVRMPDCARIRRNGTNEVSGIEPDIATGWLESDPANVRLDKTLAALDQALSGQVTARR